MADRRRAIRIGLVGVVCVAVFWWVGHPGDSIQTRYAKLEFRIPMRDGVGLFTAVYVPKNTARPYPFLVTRTPFGIAPYGPGRFPGRIGPTAAFERSGYIFVRQDVRGRFQSEGEFVDVRPHIDQPQRGDVDESTDTYDTVEWLLHNVPNNNGKVGIWGISYAGFYTSAGIIDSHPAIRAASPQAPVTDLFRGDDAYHNGAFMLAAEFLLYSSFFRVRSDGPHFPGAIVPFAYGTADAYDFFLKRGPGLGDVAATIHNPLFDTNITHDSYDEYWRSRDISRHLHNVRCAVLNVAGWFDAEDLAGPLRTYHAIEDLNPKIVNVLVVGPWEHGAWARLDASRPERVQYQAARYYEERVALPFFEKYLKGSGTGSPAEATVFETGTNQWREYGAWPPAGAHAQLLYLRANGGLAFEPPLAGETPYDEYVSDPAHPVPYVPFPTTELVEKYMFGDQMFAARRTDVLTYRSDPLPADLTIVGPVSPRLHVASSGTDADFDVKFIDLFPGEARSSSNPVPADIPVPGDLTPGYAELVRGEPMRAKFRESFSLPAPLAANEVTVVGFDMPDVNHTFRRGHRLMVQIQSSWFPLTDLNPQSFIKVGHASRQDFVRAKQRVYHTPNAPSALAVHVAPRREGP